VAGAGVVALGIGTIFVLDSSSKHNAYRSHCNGNVCDQTGLELHDNAVTAGNIATVALGAGLVLLASGAVLWLTGKPTSKNGGISVVPVMSTLGSGAVLRSTF
jgi:hypothetical protein